MTAVVHQPVRFDLRRRQIVGYVDRHLFEAQLFRREQSGVTADDDKILVDNDRLAPAKFLYRRSDLSIARSGIFRLFRA